MPERQAVIQASDVAGDPVFSPPWGTLSSASLPDTQTQMALREGAEAGAEGNLRLGIT